MRVRLNTAVLWWRHGSIVELARTSGISRATLYRWKEASDDGHSIPRWDALVKLSIALDIDPTVLLDFEDSAPMDIMRDATLAVIGNNEESNAAKDVLQEVARYMFCEGDAWPPPSLSGARAWHRAPFTGAGRPGKRWARLLITVPPERVGPQLWHWAYRTNHVKPRKFFWVPYGLVTRFSGQVVLRLYNGAQQRVPCAGESFVVETWVGDGAPDFCVASLHPFTLEYLPLGDHRFDHLPRVRFGELSEP